MCLHQPKKSTRTFIKTLNQSINGFGHYYKYGDVIKQFARLDSFIHKQVREYLRASDKGFSKNSQLQKLGLRSLLALKQGLARPIKTVKNYPAEVWTAMPSKSSGTEVLNLALLEELMAKLVEQNKQLIALSTKQTRQLESVLQLESAYV
ncbi:group II intron maturase-specific domain-containing protein [Labilibaculum sp. K2S]|uniref:group II intron maturase-specific domain-containing protein n=1 Tax=Labilibaculum sp. K2S TaxID=3056386 RepID=UPI0025A49D33|nr:group II intron maturase-specific domain-containing protein [Labilibaculum sp. K2S]MDM8162156.1 group II intron maturase-specific domain-containing protein [Labilibaculum sp. K2S]